MDIFRAYFADKQMVENDRFHGNFLGDRFCTDLMKFLLKKDANLTIFVGLCVL